MPALPVGPETWLGLHEPQAPLVRHGASRWLRERAAARRALRIAREAWETRSGAARYSVSLSHSEGAGAALVAAPGGWIGVDVMRTSRVSPRHLLAISSPAEWRVLVSHPSLRSGLAPALAWCLKEAAAKATRRPGEVFPWHLVIRRGGPSGIRVEVVGEASPTLEAGWLERAPFLYAWVTGVRP